MSVFGSSGSAKQSPCDYAQLSVVCDTVAASMAHTMS